MSRSARRQFHVRVGRPRAEVVDRWREAFPHVDPTLGQGETKRVEPHDSHPPYRLGWRSRDGDEVGTVTFTDVNRALTAVRVDIRHSPRGLLGRASVLLRLPDWRTRRALRWFATWVASQPADEPGPSAATSGSVQLPDGVALDPRDRRPLPVGIPTGLGVVAGAGHASGSPGGRGSVGASSDRVDIGGRVGPADVAAVPAVAPVGEHRD
jgi:hypothetical protein